MTSALASKTALKAIRPRFSDLNVEEADGKVVITGKAATQAEAERAILAAGNTPGVGQVESKIEVAEAAPEAKFVTVESGDTLSKIAKEHYGDA